VATRFKGDRPLKRSVRKIAQRLIDEGLDKLAVTAPSERDEAIHDARKALKKIRSLLRLIRPAISKSDYRDENRRFRDAGLPLTQARDLKILIESFDAVVTECFPDGDVPENLQEVRRLASEQLSSEHERLQSEGEVESISYHLKEARDDVRKWSRVPDRWRTLSRGLKATYRRTLDARDDAEKNQTAETCHEWRKQVRYLRYQLGFVRFLNPERLTALAGEVDRINKLLGAARDLTLLEKHLAEQFALDAALSDHLKSVIVRRREEATGEACRLAEELFAASPEEFVNALKSDWKTARNPVAVEEGQS
jgi:CHAD domain-containing protein